MSPWFLYAVIPRQLLQNHIKSVVDFLIIMKSFRYSQCWVITWILLLRVLISAYWFSNNNNNNNNNNNKQQLLYFTSVTFATPTSNHPFWLQMGALFAFVKKIKPHSKNAHHIFSARAVAKIERPDNIAYF